MSVPSEADCLALADSLVGLLGAQRRRFLANLQKFIAAESTQWHLATMTVWYIVGAHQAHNALQMIERKRYVPSQALVAFSNRFLSQMLEDPGIASHKQGISRLYFSRYSACDHTKADELFWSDFLCNFCRRHRLVDLRVAYFSSPYLRDLVAGCPRVWGHGGG